MRTGALLDNRHLDHNIRQWLRCIAAQSLPFVLLHRVDVPSLFDPSSSSSLLCSSRESRQMGIVQKLKASLKRRSSKLTKSSSSLSTSDWSSTRSLSWDFSDWNNSSDDESSCCSNAPEDVPEGFLAVYVGKERERFVIDARHLNHPWFKILLEKSAEEFGFDHKGGLTIPCEVALFEHMLRMLDHNNPVPQAAMDELVKFVSSA